MPATEPSTRSATPADEAAGASSSDGAAGDEPPAGGSPAAGGPTAPERRSAWLWLVGRARGLLDDWRRLGLAAQGERLLWAALALMALGASVAFGYAATHRVAYPFEHDWMEGGVLDHVRVVLAGEPLYRRPSLEFTPFIYTPLYYYVCALVSAVTGPSFAVARIVSSLSTVVCLLLIYSFVRRETEDSLAAFVAVGLFAATYERTGLWLDIARPDSQALAFLLGGLWLVRFGRRVATAPLGALLLFAAFLTKQTMLALTLPALVYAPLASRRRGALCVATFFGLLVGWTWVHDVVSGGWFSYYVFWVPRQHSWVWHRWHELLLRFLWDPVAVMVLWALLALGMAAVRGQGRSAWVFYLLLTLLAVGSGYAGVLHKDGFNNVFIPTYAALALVAGLGLAWARRAARGRGLAAKLRVFACVTMMLQLGVLIRDPREIRPRRSDVVAGRQMIAKLRAAPREMLMLGTGFYGYLAGHPEIHAHTMALLDVFKTRDARVTQALEQELVSAIRQGRFASIVEGRSMELLPRTIKAELHRTYRRQTQLFPRQFAHSCKPQRGYVARPEWIWLRRPPRDSRKLGRFPPTR